MQFVVIRHISIDAASPEEALERTKPIEGTTASFSVNPRNIPMRPTMPTDPGPAIPKPSKPE